MAALSTEAFVNVYVKCQDVVTAKPRYVSRGGVVSWKDMQVLGLTFCRIVRSGGTSGVSSSRH